MKLLNTQTRESHEFHSSDLPAFATLSYATKKRPTHSHGKKEQPQMPRVIDLACHEANACGVSFLWTEELCLNKASPNDMGEFVRNLSSWLRKSELCMVFLDDLPSRHRPLDERAWRRCAYWKRPWTVQELIWAQRLEFFDSEWKNLGDKSSLEVVSLLSTVSGIDVAVLSDPDLLGTVPLATRMAWMAGKSGLFDEDAAYALAAVAEVELTVRYGEGSEEAFARLQKEILRNTNDMTMLAWCNLDEHRQLASSPSDFRNFAQESGSEPWVFGGSLQWNSQGVEIRARMLGSRSQVLVEIGRRKREDQPDEMIGIWLRHCEGTYIRIKPASLVKYSACGTTYTLRLNVDMAPREAVTAKRHFESLGEHHSCLPKTPVFPSILGSKRDSSGCVKSAYRRPVSPQLHSPPGTPSGESTDEEAETSSDYDGVRSASSHSRAEISSRPDFQRVTPSLVHVVYNDIRQLCLSPLQAVSENERQPPRKRARVENQKPRLFRARDNAPRTGQSGPEVSRKYFACLFYATSPGRYQQCLLKHGLSSIEDVKRHTCKHHRKPPYCPRCGVIFGDTADRDEHLQLGSCDLKPPTHIEGLSDFAVLELKGKDDASLGDEERWHRLLNIAVPGTKVSRSPFLCEGPELALSHLRSFWAQHGRHRIQSFLQQRGLLDLGRPGELGVVAMLERLVLDKLIIKLHRDLGP